MNWLQEFFEDVLPVLAMGAAVVVPIILVVVGAVWLVGHWGGDTERAVVEPAHTEVTERRLGRFTTYEWVDGHGRVCTAAYQYGLHCVFPPVTD